MNNTDKERFESLWEDFLTLVKGKLISTSNNQSLSTPLANLILKEAVSSWNSDYEINGKWMSDFKSREPQKADLVCDILLNDMKFGEIEVTKELPHYYNYLVPTVGAIAGLGISYFSGASKIIQAVSTIVPAVLLYPAVKMYGKRKNETNKKTNIDAFMQQLEKYKNSILPILS